MDGGFLRVRFFVVTSPLPLLAEEPPSTHLSFNGHRGASRRKWRAEIYNNCTTIYLDNCP
jgi:hypothetical protein